MANNLSLGTYISDGVRVGPDFKSNEFTNFGKGVLLNAQHSYDILCSAPNPNGYTVKDNVVRSTTVDTAGFLPLRGDNYVTFLTIGPDGLPLLQLDQPRVISVTTSVADPTLGTRVTIFGYDKYLFPMQHTYVLTTVQGTYPTFAFPGGEDTANMEFPGNVEGNFYNTNTKAFYQITKIYISAALPDEGEISVGAADAFGLPYVINGTNNINEDGTVNSAGQNCGTITSIQWGFQVVDNTHEIIKAGNLTTRAPGDPLDTIGYLSVADFSIPNAHSGDVRGFYAPPTPSVLRFTELDTPPILDATNLIFTYFVQGADVSIDQQSNDQTNYMLSHHVNSPQGLRVSPLSPEKLWGLRQFYTGQPS